MTPSTPVVLLHGLATSSARTWGENGWLDLLADAGREAVPIDILGHGTAERPHGPAASAALEGDLADRLPPGAPPPPHRRGVRQGQRLGAGGHRRPRLRRPRRPPGRRPARRPPRRPPRRRPLLDPEGLRRHRRHPPVPGGLTMRH